MEALYATLRISLRMYRVLVCAVLLFTVLPWAIIGLEPDPGYPVVVLRWVYDYLPALRNVLFAILVGICLGFMTLLRLVDYVENKN